MTSNELLEPELLYKRELKDKHHDRVVKYFDELTKQSGVNIEQNQVTCKKIYSTEGEIKRIRSKLNTSRGFRILFTIMLILGIFFAVLGGLVIASGNGLVGAVMLALGLASAVGGLLLIILVSSKNSKKFESMLAELTKEYERLKEEANTQMRPLWALFDEQIPTKLFHETAPLIEMDRIFDTKKLEFLVEQYGYEDPNKENISALGVQSGSILGNPFVFFKELEMTMGSCTYEGTLVIHWTTTVRTNNGVRTVHHSQTLRAHVTKPKPYYSTDTYLMYANDAAPRLSFSRHRSNINQYDEAGIARYVRKHEKDLSKLALKEMGSGGQYTPLGNPEFELFFGGLNRDNEVEYRLLFTPLAQKSMLSLLKSSEGFGDDFTFVKKKKINFLTSAHSQGDVMFAGYKYFYLFDYRKIEEKFVNYNDFYFKSVFFDLAPLLSIPLYQQHKAIDYIYKGTIKSNFTKFEHEVIANQYDPKQFLHPESDTQPVLKTSVVSNKSNEDVVCVTAHSFKAVEHVDVVPTLGGDGRMHPVPVKWYEYIPLEQDNFINVSDIGGDRIKFNKTGNNNMIFNRGLVSYNQGQSLNISIEELKKQMAK